MLSACRSARAALAQRAASAVGSRLASASAADSPGGGGGEAAAAGAEGPSAPAPVPGSAAWWGNKPVPREGAGGRRVHDLLHFSRVGALLDAKRRGALSYDRRADVFGRDWRAKELRLKSDDDLERLWAVLAMERTRLLGEKTLLGRKDFNDPPDRSSMDARSAVGARHKAVKKSMARIKLVLHERAEASEDPDEKSRQLRRINRRSH